MISSAIQPYKTPPYSDTSIEISAQSKVFDLDELLNHLILKILFENTKKITTIQTVCKRWNTLANDFFLWKPILNARFNPSEIDELKPDFQALTAIQIIYPFTPSVSYLTLWSEYGDIHIPIRTTPQGNPYRPIVLEDDDELFDWSHYLPTKKGEGDTTKRKWN